MSFLGPLATILTIALFGVSPSIAKPLQLTPFDSHSIDYLEQDPVQLGQAAYNIFKKHCTDCHGDPDNPNTGVVRLSGNLDLFDLPALWNSDLIDFKNPEESYLLKVVQDGEMPPRGNGPSAEELKVLNDWIEAGAPSVQGEKRVLDEPSTSGSTPILLVPAYNPNALPFIHIDVEVYKMISVNLEYANKDDRSNYRYLSFAHFLTEPSLFMNLDGARAALLKTLNSLSLKPEPIELIPIDKTQTIFRIDLRELGWTQAKWNDIASLHPYQFNFETAIEDITRRLTLGTSAPFIRADWFIAHATVPPLYYQLLDMPGSLQALEKKLGIDRQAALENNQLLRVGFSNSGVSDFNRIIERSPVTLNANTENAFDGYYWLSYDFDSNRERGDIFTSPLLEGEATSTAGFLHAGGEVIFSLPNGMQAYYLADGKGSRLDKAPVQIVQDPRQPDQVVVNGFSCIACHVEGIKSKKDQVGDFARSHPDLFGDDASFIYKVYSGKEKKVFEEDQKLFSDALESIGLIKNQFDYDPYYELTHRYFYDELNLKRILAELGIEKEKLLTSPTAKRLILRLEATGGRYSRRDFEEILPTVVAESGVAKLINQGPGSFTPDLETAKRITEALYAKLGADQILPLPETEIEGDSNRRINQFGNTSINEGINDIFDNNGNTYKVGVNGQLSTVEYTDGTVVEGVSARFGEGSKHATFLDQGIFILIANDANVSEFLVRGELGADGKGIAKHQTVKISSDRKVFVRWTEKTEDPPLLRFIYTESNFGSEVLPSLDNLVGSTENDLMDIKNTQGVNTFVSVTFALSDRQAALPEGVISGIARALFE